MRTESTDELQTSVSTDGENSMPDPCGTDDLQPAVKYSFQPEGKLF